MASAGRFDHALAAIDEANAADAAQLEHSRRVYDWVNRLRPDASALLLLAARACHVRRWEVPRSSYPEGRAGYLKWRRDLYDRQASIAAELVRGAGYSDDDAARVADLVRKRDLRAGTDADVQTLEDALCLVFVETEYADLAARTAPDKMTEIVAKTLAKMSPQGRKEAAALGVS
jgi:hypothetical protein